jgi:hypothetical protein
MEIALSLLLLIGGFSVGVVVGITMQWKNDLDDNDPDDLTLS